MKLTVVKFHYLNHSERQMFKVKQPTFNEGNSRIYSIIFVHEQNAVLSIL